MQHAIDTHRVRPTPLSERGPVDVLIDSYADRKDLLISLLQEIQGELGYLPKSVLSETSQRLGIPLSRVYAVATFFRAFSLKPRGRHVVTVCMGTACHVKGAKRLVDKIERDYGLKAGDTSEDLRFTMETVNCLGCCALGPVVVVDDKYEGHMNNDKLERVLRRYK